MRQDLIDAGIEFKSFHFFRYTKGEKKGQFDLNKAFAVHVIRKFGWETEFIFKTAVPLTSGGALVIVACNLFGDNQKCVGSGLASASCSTEQIDFATLAQKATTWSLKYAVDLALGLTDEEIQEIASEIGLTKKGGFKQTTNTEPEPPAPTEIQTEDESLNEELFG